MDGCIDGWEDGKIDVCMSSLLEMDGWIIEEMDGLLKRWMDY